MNPDVKNCLTIRAGNGTLSFLVHDENGMPEYHPYTVKSGMSISANLREAFREQQFLKQGFSKAQLLIPSPVVLIPAEDYEDKEAIDKETIYSSVLTGHKGEEKILKELPHFEAAALYSINRDLKMVVSDNCETVEVENIMLPVWKHLYDRYHRHGDRRKLFAYFHDKTVDICCFGQRRLHFANVFNARHAHDALYYILFVWKQLGMDQQEDCLFLIGDMPHEQWLTERIGTYISKTRIITPDVSLNRSQLSLIEGMPFDMML